MKLNKYIQRLNYKTNITDIENIDIGGITTDSRNIKPGDIFVCIKGARFDGHNVAKDMLEKGAVAIVTEHNLGIDKQVIVEDTRYAYAIMCAEHFGNPAENLHLIAITGTNAKTTITYLIKSVLKYMGEKVGLIGTIRNEIDDISFPAKFTTPDPYTLNELFAKMVDFGCKYVVMETSSQALDQQRLDGLHFDVAVFTNFSQDHLDYHKTMENYFLAKKKLFTMCKTAIINIDDNYGKRLYNEIQNTGADIITCSMTNKDSDFYTQNSQYFSDKCIFDMIYKDTAYSVTVSMPGEFSVMNALQAIIASMQFGYNIEKCTDGIKHCYGVTGRAEVIPTNADYTIIRDFAHAPEALKKILAGMRKFTKGRLITLFGCAGNRDRTKRKIMAENVAKGSDLVILTSDNPRDEDELQIINDAKVGFEGIDTPYKIIPDRYTAIMWAIDNIKSGDLLLLAGKGHEDYQVLHDETIYFDERVIVEELLQKKKEGKLNINI